MTITTRALEGTATITASAWALLAQVTPPITLDLSPWIGLVKTVAELSPTAILVGMLIVLWRRHTSREDAVAECIKENTQALQRVADAMQGCPRQKEAQR